MEFLIQAFLRRMASYSFLTWTCSRPIDGDYVISILDVPPSLDAAIMKRKVDVPNEEGILEQRRIAKPIEDGQRRHLFIHLDKDDYAAKINALDVIIRTYSENRDKNRR